MLGERSELVVIDVTQDFGDRYYRFIPAYPREDGNVNLDEHNSTYGFNPPEGSSFVGVIHRLGKEEAQKWIDKNPEEFQRLSQGEQISYYTEGRMISELEEKRLRRRVSALAKDLKIREDTEMRGLIMSQASELRISVSLEDIAGMSASIIQSLKIWDFLLEKSQKPQVISH